MRSIATAAEAIRPWAESTRRAARGEHGAVVIGVDVDVQHPRAAAFERIAECVQRSAGRGPR